MVLSRMISAAVLAGATSIASFQPVTAAPLMMTPAIGKSVAHVETVQYRGWHRGPGWDHDGWRRHHGWRRGYYGNGAAIGGLAAGAIIGGAIASSQAHAAQADSYCSQRYKSYDPASGTYLGYDGARHPCP